MSKVTPALLEEMAYCIVDCGMGGDKATDYMIACVYDIDLDDPDFDEQISNIKLNNKGIDDE